MRRGDGLVWADSDFSSLQLTHPRATLSIPRTILPRRAFQGLEVMIHVTTSTGYTLLGRLPAGKARFSYTPVRS
jgi:hypothetical protein